MKKSEQVMTAINSDRCDMCDRRAEYLLNTSVRGARQEWQSLPTVYPERKLCLWHFALIAEFASGMEPQHDR